MEVIFETFKAPMTFQKFDFQKLVSQKSPTPLSHFENIIFEMSNKEKFKNSQTTCYFVIKPGAHGRRPHAPGFLKLLWFTCQYVCVSVCVSAPEGINNRWHDMV